MGEGLTLNLEKEVERQTDALIKATQEIITLRSVESDAVDGCPFGAEVGRALECALQIARGMGFHTVNLDGYVGYAEYGSGEDYVAVLGHLDVVPEGGNWTYPPYGGEIHEGRLYGRGASDDKGPIMAALFGLAAVKNLNLPLTKRVRIIFGTSEETGSKDMDYYAGREKPPVAGFTPDASFPTIYAEKGGCKFTLAKKLTAAGDSVRLRSLHAGERVNIVPDRAEAVLSAREPQALINACAAFANCHKVELGASLAADGTVQIVSRGKAAHGSLPHQGINAAMQLLAFLAECQLPADLVSYLKAVTDAIGRETDGRSLGIAYRDEASGSLTLNAGLLRFTGDTVALTCDVRFPVTWTGEQLIEKLQSAANNLGIDLASFTFGKPLFFPKDHSLITTLQKVFTTVTGTTVDPIAIGGGTYAKHLPNTVAFGPQFPGQPDLCHQPDEYITLDDLVLCAKIYARAIYELAR
ncbi:dipeptidase PepV [Acetonema longum]|uniref:Dipeptidase PepV n=1 Tax=Acetonema longum DSM 6540 TaxID=1009370 RepID=F7NHD7_9FIRM|nr:dipeptidase PepV [Acetonema longum]EGO64620.1 dipeptidase PepV [Acetonema longum DSM 6540]